METNIRAATNQSPLLAGHHVVDGDAALCDAVVRHGSPEALKTLHELGRVAGTEEAREHGMLANRFPPEHVPYDRFGNRVDEVRFHPSWHWLMDHAVGFGLQAAPWVSDDPHAHVRRAAGFLAWSQVEPGHACPISMTYAAIPALRADPALAAVWTPALAAPHYDPGTRPVADKRGALAGMGMTESRAARTCAPTSSRPRRRPRIPAATPCADTSGSPLPRRTTCSWCWRRPRTA